MLVQSTQNSQSSRHQQSAFTLLEVILALAILAGSVAVLGEVLELASQSASDCEAETQAQIYATTLLDEMAAGLTDLTGVDREPVDAENASPWVYSVSIEVIDEAILPELENLVAVEIVVEQDIEERYRPVKYRLVRWFDSKEVDQSDADNSSDGETL